MAPFPLSPVAGLIERWRRRRVGTTVAADYAARPQTAQEVGWADSATVTMIAEEPW